ncbi:hypothetical protein D3C83_215750 [compost metagenome]
MLPLRRAIQSAAKIPGQAPVRPETLVAFFQEGQNLSRRQLIAQLARRIVHELNFVVQTIPLPKPLQA